ncbi:MAG TPA: 4Fe-4S dicluster domain-containing protein [Deltaproteobacteria bacterium]|mgnify:CR=1 FL=1|nr:4Fe-4S dicluster domain-containing protein [Deltaproteobacteria bacterium]
MSKMLMIYPDRCTGCHNCELACTLSHDGEFRPYTSRIHVYSWETEGFSMPTTCQHCNDAPCVAVCPTGAMHDDRALDRVAWDVLKCIGCRMCTLACPFGAVVFDTQRRRIVKCDLCDGAPECVLFCPVQALEYVEEADATRSRKKAVAVEFKKTFEEVS